MPRVGRVHLHVGVDRVRARAVHRRPQAARRGTSRSRCPSHDRPGGTPCRTGTSRSSRPTTPKNDLVAHESRERHERARLDLDQVGAAASTPPRSWRRSAPGRRRSSTRCPGAAGPSTRPSAGPRPAAGRSPPRPSTRASPSCRRRRRSAPGSRSRTRSLSRIGSCRRQSTPAHGTSISAVSVAVTSVRHGRSVRPEFTGLAVTVTVSVDDAALLMAVHQQVRDRDLAHHRLARCHRHLRVGAVRDRVGEDHHRADRPRRQRVLEVDRRPGTSCPCS